LDGDRTVPGPLLKLPRRPGDLGPGTRKRLDVYEDQAPSLAANAARSALENAGLDGSSVDQLIVVTCTGFMAPGIDVSLVRKLGLRRDVRRLQVGFMGCHGAFVGLRQAAALGAADPQSTVLLVAVELCSLHFQYGWEPSQIVANALFADGAGACVIQGAEAAPPDGLRLEAHASWLDDASEEAMTWRIGDNGFQMTLSAEVPRRIQDGLANRLGDWLGERDLGLGDIGGWAVHPGGPRILTAVSRALNLPNDALAASKSILSEHGNMSSATIFFVLESLLQVATRRPWVALAFGPGLTIEAALLT